MALTENDCRWCGEPLPEPTGKRGRPALTHAGECRKRDKQRQTLQWRIQRFREAHPSPDRSDDVRGVVTTYDKAELADGYGYVRDPFANLQGPALMHAIAQWEAEERSLRVLRGLLTDYRQADDPPQIPSGLPLDADERDRVISNAVAARLRRLGEQAR